MSSAMPKTTRRTWSNGNGFNMTFETTSYSTPGFSFGTFNAGTSSRSPDMVSSTRNNQPRAGGVLGAAFNILGNVLSSQAQNTSRGNARRGSNQSDSDDDDLAFSGDEDGFVIEEERAPRPKQFKPAEPTANKSQQSRRAPRSRDQSPSRRSSRRPQAGSRSNSYRTEERKPSWTNGYRAYAEDDPEEDEIADDYPNYHGKSDRRPHRSRTDRDSAHIHELESIAERHRREIKSCRKRLEQFSRHRNVHPTVLQSIVNELNDHQEAYEDALENLEAAKGGKRGSNSSRRNTSHHSRPKNPQRRASTPSEGPFTGAAGFEGFFNGTSHRRPSMPPEEFFAGTGFERFFNGTSPRSHPMSPGSNDFFVSFGSSPFGGFERVFNDGFFSAGPRFFVHPSMPRSNFPGANTGPRFTYPTPSPATFPKPAPKPPSTLLKPEEAKALFKQYNDRWNTLSPTDPNIPYPCRGMKATALSARDTIWAPLVSSPISTWSAETIMQANTQAFFLGVVGLAPVYTEAAGKIVMGFDKARATPEQVRQLVDMLKKEKTRWHSDRLGRRNGGVEGAGPNESLQRDERARAVFHAVMELIGAGN